MSLVENVKAAFGASKQKAVEQYRAALAAGKPVDKIVALAVTAGLSEIEIAEDAGIVDKAATLADAASGHTALAKTLADATQRHDAIAAEYSSAVESFTRRLSEAAEGVEAAQAGEAPAKKAAEELCRLYRAHADILPPPPAQVRTLLEKQAREEEIAKSRDEVRRAHGRAADLERQLLQARNGVRTPGLTNRAMFEPANAAGVVGNIQQPVIGEDRAESAGKQEGIARLETQLGEAQAKAKQLSDAHAEKFAEQV